MEKMRMETPGLTVANVEKIGALFPNCVTETTDENGKLKKAINFDLLRQMLSADVVEGDEAYEFTWVGKKAAIVESNKPIRKTLRPCPDESVDWDTTENLYIEGDNLEVLKILRSTYFHKVKLIYIDPPYNTGKDFIYKDNYKKGEKEYLYETNQVDKNGKILVQNKETNGRFHTDWLNMMYPRLKLARDLLTEDGVIFISIDDHEQANLKKICDDIFGEENFVAIFNWMKTATPPSLSKNIRKKFEYVVLCYLQDNENKGLNGGVVEGGDKRNKQVHNVKNPKRKFVFQNT